MIALITRTLQTKLSMTSTWLQRLMEVTYIPLRALTQIFSYAASALHMIHASLLRIVHYLPASLRSTLSKTNRGARLILLCLWTREMIQRLSIWLLMDSLNRGLPHSREKMRLEISMETRSSNSIRIRIMSQLQLLCQASSRLKQTQPLQDYCPQLAQVLRKLQPPLHHTRLNAIPTAVFRAQQT
jgi:hypothetical protein